MTLRWRFLLLLLPVAAIGTVLSGLVSQQLLRGILEREVVENVQDDLDRYASPFVTRLRSASRGVDHVSKHLTDEYELSEATHVLELWPELDAVFAVDTRGAIRRVVTVRKDSVERVSYGRGRGPAWVWSDPPTGDPAKVRSAGTGPSAVAWLESKDPARPHVRVGGVLSAEMPTSIGRGGGSLLFFDSRGRSLNIDGASTRSTELDPRLMFELRKRLLSEKFFELHDQADEYGDWWVASNEYEELGLIAAHAVPTHVANAELQLFDLRLLAVAGTCLVLILLAAMYLSELVIRPLGAVTQQMEEVAGGNLEARLPVGSDDEFGRLARSFNSMITDLHTTHIAVKRQSTQLEEAFKEIESLDSMKDNFLALISHEVRTPLTSILGATDFLRESLAEREGFELESEFMEIVQESARRLTGFMDDALMVARLRSGANRDSFSDLSLSALLLGEFSHAQSVHSDLGVTMINELGEAQDAIVYGDWTLLQVALRKIVDNAYRHNVAGGSIELSMAESLIEDDNSDLRKKMIEVGCTPPGPPRRWVAVRIFNTGLVADADQLETLFRHFELAHSIDHHSRGSGMSLPIARDICRYHGGELFARSDGDRGMAFYLVLPGRLVESSYTADYRVPKGVDDVVAVARQQARLAELFDKPMDESTEDESPESASADDRLKPVVL